MERIEKIGVKVNGEEYLVNWGYLNLRDTQVSDLTPLEGMQLEMLFLSSTQVSDLTPLAGIQLEWLDLDSTQVSDLTPLAGMPLEWLNLEDSQVIDLTPLVGLPLRWLDLNGTPAAKKPLPKDIQNRVDEGLLKVNGLEAN